MPTLSVMFGVVLIALGAAAYLRPDLLGGGKEGQPSALSPAGVGAVLLVAGLVAMAAPGRRKDAMHLAAGVSLLGAIGGLVPVFLRSFDLTQTAVKVGLGMAVLSAIFLALCVNSFVQARRARAAGMTNDPPMTHQ